MKQLITVHTNITIAIESLERAIYLSEQLPEGLRLTSWNDQCLRDALKSLKEMN